MAGEPGKVPSRQDVETGETPPKKDRETLIKRLRRFMTSLPGFLTGLATVITATATIVGVLAHGSSPAHSSTSTSPPAVAQTSASPPKANASVSSVPAVSNSGASGARLEWSGSLLLTSDGSDLSVVPPVSDVLSESDIGPGVQAEGDLITPTQATELAVWTGNSMPTPQQCVALDTTQSSGEGVQVGNGSVVCALVPSGPLSIIRVTGIDQSNSSIETQTAIYEVADSADASVSSVPAVSNSGASGARLEWSGSLLLTSDGSDLSVVPPVSDVLSESDIGPGVQAEGDLITPTQATELAVWTGNSMPTPQQCVALDTTQSSGEGVQVGNGSVVCALVPSGPLSIIRVTGIDQSDSSIETQTALYELSGS